MVYPYLYITGGKGEETYRLQKNIVWTNLGLGTYGAVLDGYGHPLGHFDIVNSGGEVLGTGYFNRVESGVDKSLSQNELSPESGWFSYHIGLLDQAGRELAEYMISSTSQPRIYYVSGDLFDGRVYDISVNIRSFNFDYRGERVKVDLVVAVAPEGVGGISYYQFSVTSSNLVQESVIPDSPGYDNIVGYASANLSGYKGLNRILGVLIVGLSLA